MAKPSLEESLFADIIAVGNEVAALWQHHDIFWKIADVFNNSERFREVGGDLFNWCRNAYIEAGSLGFRRQLDRDDRAISLVNVLRKFEVNCATFTREGFQRKITFPPGHNFHKPDKWDEAGNTFDRLFGNVGHLDPAIVHGDIELLQTEGAAIKEQADKEIAHKDRKGMVAAKVDGQIFERCVKHLDDITMKYLYLLSGRHEDSLRPIFEYDFDEIFTFAWKT